MKIDKESYEQGKKDAIEKAIKEIEKLKVHKNEITIPIVKQTEHGVMNYYRIRIENGWLELAENNQCGGVVDISYHKEKPHYEGEAITDEEVIRLSYSEFKNFIGELFLNSNL